MEEVKKISVKITKKMIWRQCLILQIVYVLTKFRQSFCFIQIKLKNLESRCKTWEVIGI